MATIRSNMSDNASACAVLACQVLTQAELETCIQFLCEQARGSTVKAAADAVTNLADAATTLVAIAEFATALNTAGWEVAD